MELRNTDSVFKYTLSRPAALRSKYKNEYVSNTVAFKADRENHQYKLFAMVSCLQHWTKKILNL